MTSPYGDERLCESLSTSDLEDTFWYPGPGHMRAAPSKISLRQWDKAKEVCIECPVFVSCRASHWGEPQGVWGGTDQHERYVYRQKLRKRLHTMDDAERQALAASLRHRSGGPTAPDAEALALQTGYSVAAIRVLVQEHENRVAVARLARRAAATEAMEAVSGPVPAEERPVWPVGAPEGGDGWVWRDKRVLEGYYVAESADGRWLRMKLREQPMRPIIRWFEKDHVDLHREVEPVVEPFGRRMAEREKARAEREQAA